MIRANLTSIVALARPMRMVPVEEFDLMVGELEEQRAENLKLRERLEIRTQHGHNLRTMLESATETERAAVVAWLQRQSESLMSDEAGISAYVVRTIAGAIERGEHRREEGA